MGFRGLKFNRQTFEKRCEIHINGGWAIYRNGEEVVLKGRQIAFMHGWF